MKTLKLKALRLNAEELLTRVQMKNVRGGGSCCAHNSDWSQSCCGYTSASGANSAAASYASAPGGGPAYWCCDSCPPGYTN